MRDISLLTANKLMFSLTFFNRSKAILFNASLGSLKLYDKFTEGTKFELLMAPSKEYITDSTNTVVSEIQKDEKDFFKLCVEVNTPTKPVDHYIKLDLEPLNFVYNSKVIMRICINYLLYFYQLTLIFIFCLVSFFDTSVSEWRHIQDWGKTASKFMMDRLQNESKISLDITLKKPKIVLPDAFTSEDCSLMVIDLGNLNVERIPLQFCDNINESTVLYHNHTIRITSSNVLLAKYSQNWRDPSPEDRKLLRFIEDFDVNVKFLLRRVPKIDIPRFKLEGNLPVLNFHLSPIKYKQFLTALAAFTGGGGGNNNDNNKGNKPEQQQQQIEDPQALAAEDGMDEDEAAKRKKMLENNYTDIDFSFSMPMVVLSLEWEADPAILIECGGFSIGFESKAKSTEMKFLLNKFTMTDFAFDMEGRPKFASSRAQVSKTNPTGDLISVLYIIRGQNAEEDERGTFINANFDELSMFAPTQSLITLMDFFDACFLPDNKDNSNNSNVDTSSSSEMRVSRELSSSFDIASSSENEKSLYSSVSDIDSRSPTLPPASGDERLGSSEGGASDPKSGSGGEKEEEEPQKPKSKMVISGSINLFKITTAYDEGAVPLSTISLKYFSFNYVAEGRPYKVEGNFLSLGVENLTDSKELYPQAMESKDAASQEDMFDFKYESMPQSTRLNCSLKNVHFVYLHYFFQQIIDWFNDFFKRNQKARAARRVKFKDNVKVETVYSPESPRDKAGFLEFYVDMKNPIIIVPQGPYSRNVFIMDPGHLVAYNKYFFRGIDMVDLQVYYVSMKSLNMTCAEWDSNLDCLSNIAQLPQLIRETDIDVSVKYLLDSTLDEKDMRVSANFHETEKVEYAIMSNEVNFVLQRPQYQALLALFDDNFMEYIKDPKYKKPPSKETVQEALKRHEQNKIDASRIKRNPTDADSKWVVSFKRFSLDVGSSDSFMG